MISSKVAKRYARALLELAQEQGQQEAWGAELERLARIVSAPELAAVLASPELTEPQRLAAVTLIGEKLGLSYPLRSFAVVVARHGRVGHLPLIAQAYQDLADQAAHRARASLTFAAPPSDAQVALVVAALEQLSGKTVLPTVKVDPQLLGGMVAELEGRTYDDSLANRLKLLEQELSR